MALHNCNTRWSTATLTSSYINNHHPDHQRGYTVSLQAPHQHNPHKESLKSQRLYWGLIWALYGLLVVSQLSWLYYWLRFRLAWLGSRPKHSFAWPTNVDNAKFKTAFQIAWRAFGSSHYFCNSYLTAIFCYQIDYRHVWWMSAGTHKGYMIVSYWSQLCHVTPTVEWLP